MESKADHRPWGFYQVLADEVTHKVKRIVIHPGQRLSLQRHRGRSEHWFFVRGDAVVVRDDMKIALTAGQSVDIPRGAWHRILNVGRQDLVLIEVQTGEYFGENDIERADDDYGRI